MSRRGVDHPNYQGKGYAKDLPAFLAADYHRALSDEDLHTLTHELALSRARLHELVRRLQTGESRGFLVVLNEEADRLEEAARSGEAEKLRDAMASLVRLIRGAGNYESAWGDLMQQMDAVSKLASLEHKRRRDEKLLLPVEHANMMIAVLAKIVRDEVKDAKALGRISQRFAAVLGKRAEVPAAGAASQQQPQQIQSLPPDRVIDVDVAGGDVAGDEKPKGG